MSKDLISEWLTSGEYMPEFLRDFHSQKDLFKTMHNTITNADENGIWRDGHIYVVDTFLWYMARCGHTLQRSRKQVPFKNMEDDIAIYKNEMNAHFSKMLTEP
ncbi:hypothetical protein JK229_04320 [Pantoea dispersa]|uniref:hypothetical protein n=1 Tax=Pantoea dispersa TaxID=59814 RepID=UPI001BA870D8|nr:hypothetical protein [Pantoea dispersa]MBS0904349.1 hypothetical protein [Pantoea dispersa]